MAASVEVTERVASLTSETTTMTVTLQEVESATSSKGVGVRRTSSGVRC